MQNIEFIIKFKSINRLLDIVEWVDPYTESRCSIKNIKTTKRVKGIYLIRIYDKIVYVGKSNYNVKNVLYRHFQNWNPDRMYKHYRAKYNRNTPGIKVAIILSDNPDQLEIDFIKYLRPRDNKNMYEALPEEFIKSASKEGITTGNYDKDPF